MKLLIPKLLYPVAEEIYRDFFASVRAGLVVEQSHQGQLYRVIRMYVDVPAGVSRSPGAAPIPSTPARWRRSSRRAGVELQAPGPRSHRRTDRCPKSIMLHPHMSTRPRIIGAT